MEGSAKASNTHLFAAEFIGTFMLVLTVGYNVLLGNPVWAATSIACCLMASIYALGNVSGANFNPAVSFAFYCTGDMSGDKAVKYIITQMTAGFCAAVYYGATVGAVFNLAPMPGYLAWQVGLAEIFYTFMLCFVVLNCCAREKETEYYGLAIGFVIVAGGYAAGHISGGCFNPAVAFGIDLSSARLGFGWCVFYTVFELIGAAAAAGLYNTVRATEQDGSPTEFAMITSEFLGTYMLVLTVGLNVLGGSKAAAFSIAAALMCMIFSLGDVSGAHFNPAVTVAILARKRGKHAGRFFGFIVVQLLAGVFAGFTYATMENWRSFALSPAKGYHLSSAVIAETIFTFVLCYVVLCVATVENPYKHCFGLAIGSCITVGGFAAGPVSGGSLNPAVSVGIAVSHSWVAHLDGLDSLFVALIAAAYIVAEVLGGLLAFAAFKVTHKGEK